MEESLLEYFNRELVAFREMGGEFAKVHPGIADRLYIKPGDTVDPYAERIVEAFSLLAARLKIKLDAEFPRFAARLLEVIYPNYTAPVPSMAVARFFPDVSDRRVVDGFKIARGARLVSRVAPGEQTPCEFRTGQDVVLFRLEITSASLTGVPRDLGALERFVSANTQIRGALRLHLRTTGESTFRELGTLDRLPVYLPGELNTASHLFELVHADSAALLVVEPGAPGKPGRVVGATGADAVAHAGLSVEEGLLPLTWSRFHGHNLLQEYFACPGRFHFFALTGLAALLSRVQGRNVEFVILVEPNA
ncbi:Protein ImpG/VasA [Candidatus Paraburkholderia schumanniana]|nr:Protein ImpG/VasA [Candidatus Paraburkholderia schumannianae]